MEKLDAVRLALAELGDVPSEQIVEFTRGRLGIEIDVRFVPVFKATIRDRESVDRIRQEARAAALAAVMESPPKPKGRKSKKQGSESPATAEKHATPTAPTTNLAGVDDRTPANSCPSVAGEAA